MLQKIHDKTKGWVAAVILGLVCVAFAFWGVEYYINGGTVEGKVLAKVGNKSITERDIAPVARQLQQQVIASGTTITDGVLQQIKMMALQNVLAEYVLTEAATRSGFVISRDQTQQFLMNLPAFQVNGQFSPDKFEQYARNNGLNPLDLFLQLKNSLLVDQVMGGVQSGVFVLQNELEYYYNLFYQTRSFQYLIVPASRFLSEVVVTPELMTSYYQNNREVLRLPEKVSIEYLLVSPEKIRQSVTVSDAAIARYYQEHAENYRDAEQKQRPLATVKDTIRTALLLQKVQNKLAHTSDRLSNLVFTNPDSLDPAAKALNLPIQSTDFFSATGTATGITSNKEVLAAAFSPEILQQKNNSGIIMLKEGDLVVLRIKNYLPSEVPKFDAVKETIEKALRQQLAQAKAVLLANKLQAAIQKGANLNDVAAKNGFAWVSKQNIKRTDKNISPALTQAAFTLAKTNTAGVTSVAMSNGDTALVVLDSIKAAQFSTLSEKQKTDFQQKIQQMLADMTYQFYMLSVQKNIPVKIYPMK